MNRALVGVALVAMTLAAACSDDEPEAAPTTEPSRLTAPPAPTTEAPPTTESAPTTEPPATTTSTSSSTTSTSTSTTTTSTAPPPTGTEGARAAFEEYNARDLQCQAQMPECDTSFYADYIGEPQLQTALDQMVGWQSRGYTLRNLESISFRIEEVGPVQNDTGAVNIQYCVEDGSILTAPDGSAINDEFISRRVVAFMRLGTDGNWRIVGYNPLTDPVVGAENSICR